DDRRVAADEDHELPGDDEDGERHDDRSDRGTVHAASPACSRWDRISMAALDTIAPSRRARDRGRGASMGTTAATRPGPGVITTTRSASRIASGMLWLTMTIVVSVFSQRPSSSR